MRAKELKNLERIAKLMDSQFAVPGTSIRFGLDSIIGLVPGIGDSASAIITLYIVHKAYKHNLPTHVKHEMLRNTFIDWLIGLIPLVGDIFDIRWKANLRNVALLRKHTSL